MAKTLSIIIPILNEAEQLRACLEPLQYLREAGVEVILCDGGSTDGSLDIAAPLVEAVVIAEAGRALQMNAGAAAAEGEWLLFLHADTRLPSDLLTLLDFWQSHAVGWVFFHLALSGRHPAFRVIERAINIRSGMSSIGTGDQCLFVRRQLFQRCRG